MPSVDAVGELIKEPLEMLSSVPSFPIPTADIEEGWWAKESGAKINKKNKVKRNKNMKNLS